MGQQSQHQKALGLPPAWGSPPHTAQWPPPSPICPRAQTLPTHDLYAWNDDATLSIMATTTLKIRIHLSNY